MVPLAELHPFPDHPFQVRDNESMRETAASVKENGVIIPGLVRPREEGGYEIIAGHRRKHACELAGLTSMPVIVRDMDRDSATIVMVDSNLQRESILPSERAKAYKMKLDAIKRRAGRPSKDEQENAPNVSANFRSDDEVGQDAGVSGDTIRNYIALTQLVPELQKMVDDKKIALPPAYQLAALTPKEQALLLETIYSEQATPSLSQAQRMKKLSQSGELNEDTMLQIMAEQKKPERTDICHCVLRCPAVNGNQRAHQDPDRHLGKDFSPIRCENVQQSRSGSDSKPETQHGKWIHDPARHPLILHIRCPPLSIFHYRFSNMAAPAQASPMPSRVTAVCGSSLPMQDSTTTATPIARVTALKTTEMISRIGFFSISFSPYIIQCLD